MNYLNELLIQQILSFRSVIADFVFVHEINAQNAIVQVVQDYDRVVVNFSSDCHLEHKGAVLFESVSGSRFKI